MQYSLFLDASEWTVPGVQNARLPHTGQLCNTKSGSVGYCVSRADQDCDYDCVPCTMYIVLSFFFIFILFSFIDVFVLCMHLMGMPLIALCTDLSV